MCIECNSKEEYKSGLCRKCYKAMKAMEFYKMHPEKAEEYAKKKELKKLIIEMDEFGMPEQLQEIFLFGGSRLDSTLKKLDWTNKKNSKAVD